MVFLKCELPGRVTGGSRDRLRVPEDQFEER